MTTINWQDHAQHAPKVIAITTANPWFAITMGLLGLIIGFAVHRFFIPMTLSASVSGRGPTVTQGIVVQPSPTPLLTAPAGGGCGMGGGGCGCGT